MVFREQRPACIECRGPMEEVGSGDEPRYFRCEPCDAALIAEGAFAELLARAEPAPEVTDVVVHNDGSQRHSCPVCGEVMDVAWLEFLRLERCPLHGLWLGRGALARALAHEVPEAIVELTRRWKHVKNRGKK